MAAATLRDIRSGLAARLTTIAGLGVAPYLASPAPYPLVELERAASPLGATMGRGSTDWTFTVRALAGLADTRAAELLLDSLADLNSATSIQAALEADKTLGGVAQTLFVEEVSEDRVYKRGGNACLGCEFTVRVIAAGH